VFPCALGSARRAEKTRLQHEHARSLRVLQQGLRRNGASNTLII
jgi:hypothetical protein